jgi:hypothetical protein
MRCLGNSDVLFKTHAVGRFFWDNDVAVHLLWDSEESPWEQLLGKEAEHMYPPEPYNLHVLAVPE